MLQQFFCASEMYEKDLFSESFESVIMAFAKFIHASAKFGVFHNGSTGYGEIMDRFVVFAKEKTTAKLTDFRDALVSNVYFCLKRLEGKRLFCLGFTV